MVKGISTIHNCANFIYNKIIKSLKNKLLKFEIRRLRIFFEYICYFEVFF